MSFLFCDVIVFYVQKKLFWRIKLHLQNIIWNRKINDVIKMFDYFLFALWNVELLKMVIVLETKTKVSAQISLRF